MAKPTPKQANRTGTSGPRTVEVVDPRWLLKMLGLMMLLALLCCYLLLGVMFDLGSWQLVLHPTRAAGGTGITGSERVQFMPDGTGKPQLAGEWIPAEPGSTRGAYAILYLRGADGQLDAADGTQIAALRALGLNTLAFDYRGYGGSAERPHPSEDRMLEDAVSAWEYVTGVRHIPPANVLLFANGVGVSLAVQLLQHYGPGAGLIAYNADPEVENRVRRDARSHLFPLHLVFHDRFPLDGLQHLAVPKLLYTVGPLDAARIAAYSTAADPKLTVEVPTHNPVTEETALRRFLDTNVTSQPQQLTLPGAGIK